MQENALEKITAIKACRQGMMIYLKKDIYLGRSLDLYGEFSEGEIAVFSQLIRPGDVVIDAGANIGAHTVFFAKTVGAAGAVIAYEPLRFVHQLLCANIALNELTNVHTRHAALSDVSGQIAVPVPNYKENHSFGGFSIGAGNETVLMETIDSLNLQRLRFIKIDVEGMEVNVVRGAVQTIQRLRPILYLENDRHEKSAELIELLLSLNYRIWWHLPTLFNPNNFFGNNENIFGNIVSLNLLCVPKEAATNIDGLREVLSPNDRWF